MKKILVMLFLGFIGLSSSNAQSHRTHNGRKSDVERTVKSRKVSTGDHVVRQTSGPRYRGGQSHVDHDHRYDKSHRRSRGNNGSRYGRKNKRGNNTTHSNRHDRVDPRYNNGSGKNGSKHRSNHNTRNRAYGNSSYNQRNGRYKGGHKNKYRKKYNYGNTSNYRQRDGHFHHSRVVYANNHKPVCRRSVKKLRNSRVVNYNGTRYHCADGRYYRYQNNRYVASCPINYRVNSLPRGFVNIFVNDRPYYYYGGLFYQRLAYNRGYEIIEAPINAIVYTLPSYAQEVYMDGYRYFESDGTLYEVVITPDGKAFKVAGTLDY